MNTKSFWIWLALAELAIFLVWLWFANFLLDNQGTTFASDKYGDSFGSLNALFSGMALVAIVVSLIIQRKDLQSSIDEMKEANQHSLSIATINLLNIKVQASDLHFRISQSTLELKARQVHRTTIENEYKVHLERLLKIIDETSIIQKKIHEQAKTSQQ